VAVSQQPSAAKAKRQSCPYARAGLAWFRGRYITHTLARGASIPQWRKPRNCADARYLANVWAKRSYASRLRTQEHLREAAERTLRDFDVRPGYSGWQRAVEEVQRVYPGTKNWLLSCSSSEGGWGRFVFNSQGSGAAGWLQYMPGTFVGFYARAEADARRKGFRVDPRARSLYSPLGQALAGGWALRNGLTHHWVGHGC
jgi:hypothetical protein